MLTLPIAQMIAVAGFCEIIAVMIYYLTEAHCAAFVQTAEPRTPRG